MIEATDGIVFLEPFVARRRVVFADCDPAGVVFSGNFYDFALWAYQLYLARRLRPIEPVATPMKAANLVHHAPLAPGDDLDMLIRARRVGRTTFTLAIEGTCGGRPVFDAELTLICRAADGWRSVPVPDALRSALLEAGADENKTINQEDVP